MNVFGQLVRAQVEVLSADPASRLIGRLWYNSSTGILKTDDGSNIRHILMADSSGNLTVPGTLAVTGAVSLSSTLAVSSTSSLLGNVTMGGTLTVASDISTVGGVYAGFVLTTNATIGGVLSVSGAATFSSTIAANGIITLGANLNFNNKQAVSFVAEKLSSAPSVGTAGRIFYRTDLLKLYFDTGVTLTELSTGNQTLAQVTAVGATTADTVTVGQLIDSGLTANTVAYANGSKQLTSSSVTPTELSYLSGVSSAIQTQLGLKAPLAGPTFTGTVLASAITTTGRSLFATSADIGTSLTQLGDQAAQALLSGTTQEGVHVAINANSSATSRVLGLAVEYRTANSSFTAGVAAAVRVLTPTKGAASTITRNVGLLFQGVGTVGTNNAFITDNEAFTGDYFINSTSTNASLLTGVLTLAASGIALDVTSSQAGATLSARVYNTESANGASHARALIQSGGASGGDPYTMYSTSVTNWCAGIDNSDSDKFKICGSTSALDNNMLVIDTSGNVGVGVSPGYFFHAQKDQNAGTTLAVQNDTNGTNARAVALFLNTTSNYGTIGVYSATNTAYTEHVSRFVVQAEAGVTGLTLCSGISSTDMRFYTAGTAASNRRMTIDSSGNVGIGNLATSILDRLDIRGPASSTVSIFLSAYGTGAQSRWIGRAARGTLGSETALQSGDLITGMIGRGANAAAAYSSDAVSIQFATNEIWSSSANGTIIQFKTTTNTTQSLRERFRISDDGLLRCWYDASDANSATIELQAKGNTPSNPGSSSEAKMYVKSGKFIIQYNDAGTVRYKYLDLTSTGVTWTHATVAP